MREINAAGLKLLQSFERCELSAYQDSGGIWTIGWGHTGPEVVQGMSMTQIQADLQLKKDLEKFYQLDHYLTEQVNDNQYSALICLAYNIGLMRLKLSNTLKCVNEQLSPDKEWMGFDEVKINGVLTKSAGLARRRAAELTLYHSLD